MILIGIVFIHAKIEVWPDLNFFLDKQQEVDINNLRLEEEFGSGSSKHKQASGAGKAKFATINIRTFGLVSFEGRKHPPPFLGSGCIIWDITAVGLRLAWFCL